MTDNTTPTLIIEKATGYQTGWIDPKTDAIAYMELWYGKNWSDLRELKKADR